MHKDFDCLPRAAAQCEVGLAKSWQHREQDRGGTVKSRWQIKRLIRAVFFLPHWINIIHRH
jgi:hypothetical protein